MNELFGLTPGSRAARKQRCSCLLESTQLDPNCPIHEMRAFRHLKQRPVECLVIDFASARLARRNGEPLAGSGPSPARAKKRHRAAGPGA